MKITQALLDNLTEQAKEQLKANGVGMLEM